MEPWLDSLSEDWKSEHRSSSPAASVSSRRQSGGRTSVSSRSRIPHLAQNMRKDSSGSYLKPRSTRGLARAKTDSVLGERSASSLNLPPSNYGSQKRMSLSTFPRRASSAFSESQTSVQHYTLNERPNGEDTPDWKRRLANGEDIVSDGFDLFAPSKLEGMFKQPTTVNNNNPENESSFLDNLSKQWKPFTLPTPSTTSEQYQSLRASRARPTEMEVLEEVDEEENDKHALSAISSDVVRHGSIRGIVRQRVQSLERACEDELLRSSPQPIRQSIIETNDEKNDPRWRTISGQQEMMNELISPVTVSKQNTLRDNALRESVDMDISALDQRLADLGFNNNRRPSSRSSDRNISYATDADCQESSKMNDDLADLTSQSLPEDLSMGTQDFALHGGFINQRRGGYSNEASFLRRSLSSSDPNSRLGSRSRLNFHSSPPSFTTTVDDSISQSKPTASVPTSPHDDSVVHHPQTHLKPSSSGSPLKLFGNRDTYTNNKLMRILSQFEEPDPANNEELMPQASAQQPENLRMSQFGMGELDNFSFKEKVERPRTQLEVPIDHEPKIFVANEPRIEDQTQAAGMTKPTEPSQSKVASPLRTPKRRRTLVKEEITVQNQHLEVRVNQIENDAKLAGKKRKDAKPGDAGAPAEPEVLASRTLLQPKSTRRSSSLSIWKSDPNDDDDADLEQSEDLTEALAAELATFAQEAAGNQMDSRKPSLATKDYMEEANKVMEFIRARGKPKPSLPDIEEPVEYSELNPDAILDLDIDDESTKDNFSRPPSREGVARPVSQPRNIVHDTKTASYLRKFRDDDDLELIANTSGLESMHTVDNRAAYEASLIPIPDDQSQESQESSPPNMRILNHSEMQRKRKHSGSTAEGAPSLKATDHASMHSSSDSSTRRTFPTTSSAASGNKGMITHGTVVIPDVVGTMTFDHERKIWVKKSEEKKGGFSKGLKRRPRSNTEDDPFENIPDLSIDEIRDLELNMNQKVHGGRKIQKPTGGITRPSMIGNDPIDAHEMKGSEGGSVRSEASKHEIRLHDGIPSRPPVHDANDKKQPRVVTIAFSSPLVSAINYPDESTITEAELDEAVDLPLDDSEISISHTPEKNQSLDRSRLNRQSKNSSHRLGNHRERIGAEEFVRRPISRIEERDEEEPNFEMSLVRVRDGEISTPSLQNHHLIKARRSKTHGSSILCLTPLSDFTLHQIDNARHPEESYVEERPNPKALRQAHGALALTVDELVKAITDAEPTELYWEHVRRLSLGNKDLSTLHGLQDYCSSLEELSVVGNKISQLSGLPSSIRTLNMQENMLTSLTSWSQLHNLQYVDVSHNQLDNLDGLSSLVHLRTLVANNNHINNIDGVFDLNGLLELQLRGNELTEVNFDSSDLVRLTKLNVSDNQLRAINGLHRLVSLENLQISNNDLTTFVTDGDTGLESLETLDISYNDLISIELDQFPQLKTLNLDNNCIRSVSGLSEAYQLQDLFLREQSDSPDLIDLILSSASECRKICMSANIAPTGTFELPQIPQCNLRELELAGCGISELPAGFGDMFPNCRKLNLNFNAINDIYPLQGMLKLSKLLLARNRIKRLRRTCLLLSKFQQLTKVDLRDNTLTVGFYAPLQTIQTQTHDEDEKYVLPRPCVKQDKKWTQRLDEITVLRRRMIELLLGQGCDRLVELDGLEFAHSDYQQADTVWENLTGKGIFVRQGLQQDDECGKEDVESAHMSPAAEPAE